MMQALRPVALEVFTSVLALYAIGQSDKVGFSVTGQLIAHTTRQGSVDGQQHAPESRMAASFEIT